MGTSNYIGADFFPEQGAHAGKRVEVCFHYNTSETWRGTVVRDDTTEPHLTIIALDDGRHLLATECQYKTLT